MSNKTRIIIIGIVAVLVGFVLLFPHIRDLVSPPKTSEGEVTKNILTTLNKAEEEKRPVFIDFYGAY